MYFPFCCLTCRFLCHRCTLSVIEFNYSKEYYQDRKIQVDVYHWKLIVNTLEMIILKDFFFSPIGRCSWLFISACISVKVTAHHWYLDCRCRVYGTVPRTMSLDSTDFELFHYVVVWWKDLQTRSRVNVSHPQLLACEIKSIWGPWLSNYVRAADREHKTHQRSSTYCALQKAHHWHW